MGERKSVAIWADGACVGNPGPGGYGAVLVCGKHRRELSAGFRRTTNNRMELRGAIEALALLKEPCSVVLVSDSRYVVDAMKKKWPDRWAARGWKKADGQPAANPDLWQRLVALAARHEITWRWVRGHAQDVENCRCDALANAAARGRELAEDDGYR